jgi:hypothetical protein
MWRCQLAAHPGGLLAAGGVVWATNVIAFWTATAISPTDISAIKPRAKLLMMLEAGCSIVLAALVIARAVNVF